MKRFFLGIQQIYLKYIFGRIELYKLLGRF